VKAVTGVELPKYYNPTAINPLKYAEQIKKRQLLWGTKKSDDAVAETAPEAQKPVAAEPKPSTAAQSQGGYVGNPFFYSCFALNTEGFLNHF
jgi:hypothetical protein